MSLTWLNHLLINHLPEQSFSEGVVILFTLQRHELTIILQLLLLLLSRGMTAVPLEKLGNANQEVGWRDEQAAGDALNDIHIHLLLNGLFFVHIEAAPLLDWEEEA